MDSKLQPMTLLTLLGKYREIFLRYRVAIGLGVLALVVTNGAGIAIPWQIKTAVDTIQQIFNGTRTGLEMAVLWQRFHQSLWLIIGFSTLVLISRIASRQFLLGAGRRIEFDLRNRLYAHLLKLPTEYFTAHPPGELMSRLTNDVDATKFLTGGGIMLGVNTILAYALAIPMMLVLNWPLALVTFLAYPVMIFVMTRISRKVRKGYYDVQESLADLSTLAQENLSGMAVIQSYAREGQEDRRFRQAADRYFDTYTGLIHERILLFMVLAGLSGFSMLMVLLVGGWEVIGGRLDWGGFVAFTMYLEQLAWPTMALGWTISVFQQGTAALERIDEVLSTESHLQAPQPGSARPDGGIPGEIEVKNLTFAYRNPYQEETEAARLNVLEDISLRVRPGETVGLVGPVGSGKSTLLRLLPRLYHVPAGHIFLDGLDINRYELADLRVRLVFMPQLSFLFSSTVSQNIAFGRPDVLDALERELEGTIIPAATAAGVHHDIANLPAQYETLVGERGLMLSGGQRQRVALARSILVEAPVLILDDPVSNVDAETERNIVQAMAQRKIFENRTTLLATHRFSLLRLCDRVALMDAGRIVAVGTHEELLSAQPLYQRLHRLQELRESLGEWDMEADGSGREPGSLVPDAEED